MSLSRRHALILLLIGSLSAFAALFAPDGRWLGMDPGAIGASAFPALGASLRLHDPDRIDQLYSNRVVLHWTVLTMFRAVLSHLIGRSAGGGEVDERDLRLRHRADRAGHTALILIVIIGVGLLATLPESWLDWWLEPIVLANVLIGMLMAKVFVENLVLTYSYRAGCA